MARDYKIRGKRIDNGKWVIGDLLHIGGGAIIYTGSHTDIEIPEIESARIAVELMMDEVAVVHSDSVGQYTGLKDKNGKDIFEGDIVRSISDWGDFGKIGEVVFVNGKFVLDTHDDFFGGKYRYKEFVEKEEWEDFKAQMVVRFEYEVIGNVIDKNIPIKVGDYVTLTDPINNGQRVKVEEIQDNGYIVYNGGISNNYKVFLNKQ